VPANPFLVDYSLVHPFLGTTITQLIAVPGQKSVRVFIVVHEYEIGQRKETDTQIVGLWI